ncbi:MAG: hypothetical protein M1828_000864 [Chrysothrix sp. TS-e1954]|nr:MAG: hypothetical protein M1828_000864 [Chrysothrix sp. TS-e1954]
MDTRWRSDSLDSSYEMAYTSSTNRASRQHVDYGQIPQEAYFSPTPNSTEIHSKQGSKTLRRAIEVEGAIPVAHDDGANLLTGGGNSRVHVSSFKDVIQILRWWQPELFAVVLTLAAFNALVAVLKHYDGVAVQDLDFPSALTLNGLIALLSTFIRAALMVPIGSALSQEAWLWLSENRYHRSRHGQLRDFEFTDAASRGAWGSFLSLFRTRRSWLAYLAAMITIVSLSFSLFTQQLLAFKSFPVFSKELRPGNIARMEYFGYSNYDGNPAEGGNAISVHLPLKAATYNGILSDTATPANPLCATGNCTWPITPSLGFCGACSHVKSEWEHCNKTGAANPAYPNSTFPGVCQIKMPSGNIANLTNAYATGDEGTGFQIIPSTGYVYPQSDVTKLWVANFEMVGQPYGSFEGGTGRPGYPEEAIECAIWMCVKAFQVNTTASDVREVVVEEFSDMKNASFEAIANRNATFLPIPQSMNPRPDANFGVLYLSVLAITTLTSQLFVGNITVNLESQTPSSDVAQALWAGSSDPHVWMQNLVKSMTNGLRLDTPQPHDMYNGTALQLGYTVRWAWIILPAVLVFLSLLVLFATIIKTVRSPIRPWKGSPLAFLFLDVDKDLRQSAEATMDTFRGIERSIGETRVNVINNGTGNWLLRKAQ